MTWVEIGGFKLAYRWAGAAEGPVLVLAHSLGTTNAMWRGQLAALGKRFRLLLYDHRGHGVSELPPGPWSIGDFGRDVLGLLDHLGLDRVHFCGLSLGGMVGMWLAGNVPGRVSRLVLCNTAAVTEDPTLLRLRIAEVDRNGVQGIVESVLSRWFTEGFRGTQRDEVGYMRRMISATSPFAYAETSRVVLRLDLRAELERIIAPTLVVLGKQDQATPPEWNRAIAAAIRQAGVVELEAAHLSNIEARDAFNEAVLAFLVASDSC